MRIRSETDPTRRWHLVTGLLKDIATGNGPSGRWGIDTNWSAAGGGYRVVRWSGSSWAATSARGVRNALCQHHSGNTSFFLPWVVKNDGKMIRAANTTGSSWTAVPDLPSGIGATDIGGGGFGSDSMLAVGLDGNLYLFSETEMRWSAVAGAPHNLIRVATGPWWGGLGGVTANVPVLTSSGQVFSFCGLGCVGGPQWKQLGTADLRRTDVSALGPMVTWDFAAGSIMTTSSTSPYVRTFDEINNQFEGEWVGTGPYHVGSYPIGTVPVAVSSDYDQYRVRIVTASGNVYYGD